MDSLIRRVDDPHLALVGRQADAVAGTAMPLDSACLETGDFDTVQLLFRRQVSDLEAQQIVDAHVSSRAGSVDGEGANRSRQWPDFLNDLVGLGIGDK
jgi:hypothetical protein